MTEKKNTGKIKLVLGILLALFILVTSLQNVRNVELDFFWWRIDLPLVILLFVNTVFVALVTYLLTIWVIKRK